MITIKLKDRVLYEGEHVVEAETVYLRHVLRGGEGILEMKAEGHDIAPARYDLDEDREIIDIRHRQLWEIDESRAVGPSSAQVRAISDACGMQRPVDFARVLGVSPRNWRSYCSSGPARREVPHPLWMGALHCAFELARSS